MTTNIFTQGIEATRVEALSDRINKWIGEVENAEGDYFEIISISYTTAYDRDGEVLYSALILYSWGEIEDSAPS